jgi:hypothetical protein
VLYAGKNIPNTSLSDSPVHGQKTSSKSIPLGKALGGAFMFVIKRDAKKIYPNSGDGEINVRG